MFKVQRHYENDNGKDAIWMFNNEEKALAFFYNLIDGYSSIVGLPPRIDDCTIDFKRFINALFTNSDESYTQYFYEEVEIFS